MGKRITWSLSLMIIFTFLYLVYSHIGGTTTMLTSLKEYLQPIKPFLILPEVTNPSAWHGGKLDFSDDAEELNLVFTINVDSRKAPHPYASSVFLNWLLGKEGQAIWTRASGYASRRLDAPTEHLNIAQKLTPKLTINLTIKNQSL